MRKQHTKNTIRYYMLIVLVLIFLFFSGDFGLIDVQKTALIMAVGVDREQDTFIVTSQIAIPQSSKQGGSSETVQIVSRGKTVADAFEEINAKTGWYPKLVFCRLIILGEKTAQENVFDALDFFLLDEYMSDNCLVATCDGTAKQLLNVSALVDKSGSVAMQKVLSSHAERVGTVLPATLREFAIGYYGDSKSGYLPVLKTQPQQEKIGEESEDSMGGSGGNDSNGGNGENSGSGGSSGNQGEQSGQQSQDGQQSQNGQQSQDGGSGSQENQSSQSGQSGESGQQSQGTQSEQSNQNSVFSAGETALFVAGKRVATLTEEETYAFNAVHGKLRLAAFTVQSSDVACTLSVKRNSKNTKLKINEAQRPTLKIELVMTAGLLDYAGAFGANEGIDGGDVPAGAFSAAEKLLSAKIIETFEKCRACGCDLFEVGSNLQKYHPKRYAELQSEALKNSLLEVTVRFRNVR